MYKCCMMINALWSLKNDMAFIQCIDLINFAHGIYWINAFNKFYARHLLNYSPNLVEIDDFANAAAFIFADFDEFTNIAAFIFVDFDDFANAAAFIFVDFNDFASSKCCSIIVNKCRSIYWICKAFIECIDSKFRGIYSCIIR